MHIRVKRTTTVRALMRLQASVSSSLRVLATFNANAVSEETAARIVTRLGVGKLAVTMVLARRAFLTRLLLRGGQVHVWQR